MKIAIAVTAILLAGTMAWGYRDEPPVDLGDATHTDHGNATHADQGKLLFENVKLGTNGKSCATCHPGGRKLEWAATFPDDKLVDITNTCITKSLKGKPLAVDSAEMKSLVRYIKTFGGP